MKKIILFFAVLLAFCITVSLPLFKSHPATLTFKHEQSYEALQSETVTVDTDDGTGSGVVIVRGDRTFVWTAAHVVTHFSSVDVKQSFRYNGATAGEQIFPAQVICRMDNDIALLWVHCPPGKLAGARWTSDSVGVGCSVISIGTLNGKFDGSVSIGIVSQVGVSQGSHMPWKCADQATTVVYPGASGGPIFFQGQIAGLVVGWPGLPQVSLFVPVRDIYRAARESNILWAMWGRECPCSDKVLKDAVKSAAPPEQDVDAFLKMLLGK